MCWRGVEVAGLGVSWHFPLPNAMSCVGTHGNCKNRSGQSARTRAAIAAACCDILI